MKKTIIYIVILLIVAGAFSLVFSDMNQPAKNSIAVLIGSNSNKKSHPGFASANYPTIGKSSRNTIVRSAHNQSAPSVYSQIAGTGVSKIATGNEFQRQHAISGSSVTGLVGKAQQTISQNSTGLIAGNTYRYSGDNSSTQNKVSNNNLKAASSTLSGTSFSTTSGGSGTQNRLLAPGATNEEDPLEPGGGDDNTGGYNDVPVGDGLILLALLAGLYFLFIFSKTKTIKQIIK